MPRRLGLVALLLTLFALPAQAQQEGLLQIRSDLSLFLERQYAAGLLPDAFVSAQPLSAYTAQAYLDSLALRADELGPTDRRLLARYRGEAAGPGVRFVREYIPFLYEDGQAFLSVEGEDYGFELEPLAYLSVGQGVQTETEDREGSVTTWQNTRGARFAGHVGPRIFFEARLEENQRRALRPQYSGSEGGRTAPRLGITKFYEDTQVLDYWVATGIVGYRTEHFEVRFGRDRNRWGYGTGSLLLSNYAPVYDQLQIRTTVWRFQYTNLFTRYTYAALYGSDSVRPHAYGALHRLEARLPGRVRLGLFEAIQFYAEEDSDRDGYDLAYVNPIIFYRAVEADRGSPDNALIGLDASWLVTPGVQVYGQFLLDELDVEQIGQNWWGNKWGSLLGLHLADVGLDGLSARFEFTRQRPFLYSHGDPRSAYVHHGDVLGHPAGPNSLDYALFLDYRPLTRLHLALDAAYTLRGRSYVDDAGDLQNAGEDPTLSYRNTRINGGEAVLLQGVRQDVLLVEARVEFELLPDLYLTGALRAQRVDDEALGVDRYVEPFVLLRWGLPFQSLRY